MGKHTKIATAAADTSAFLWGLVRLCGEARGDLGGHPDVCCDDACPLAPCRAAHSIEARMEDLRLRSLAWRGKP